MNKKWSKSIAITGTCNSDYIKASFKFKANEAETITIKEAKDLFQACIPKTEMIVLMQAVAPPIMYINEGGTQNHPSPFPAPYVYLNMMLTECGWGPYRHEDVSRANISSTTT